MIRLSLNPLFSLNIESEMFFVITNGSPDGIRLLEFSPIYAVPLIPKLFPYSANRLTMCNAISQKGNNT